jgi:neutral ceramidase
MLLIYIILLLTKIVSSLRIGTGISDITGPIVQVMMMGYAEIGQTGEGLLQRLWARSYIIDDGIRRIVFVNTDTQSMGDVIKARVIRQLEETYGTLYNEKNVMISSTHSHSGMGGYLQHSKFFFFFSRNVIFLLTCLLHMYYLLVIKTKKALYEISVLGWIEETTKPLIDGICQSIVNAHNNLQQGNITLSTGELLDTNINRSPQSYLLNPENERSQYKYNVDKLMTVLKFQSRRGDDLGLVSW